MTPGFRRFRALTFVTFVLFSSAADKDDVFQMKALFWEMQLKISDLGLLAMIDQTKKKNDFCLSEKVYHGGILSLLG